MNELVHQMDQDLLKIKQSELRIVNQKQEQLDNLVEINQNKVTLLKELKTLAENNNQKLQELENIEVSLISINDRLDAQVVDGSGQSRIHNMKEQLQKLKKEVDKQHLREGVLRNEIEKGKFLKAQQRREQKRINEKKKQGSMKINASKFSYLQQIDEVSEMESSVINSNNKASHSRNPGDKLDLDYSWDPDFD